MMRKITAAAIAIFMLAALSACGDNEKPSDLTDYTTAESVSQPAGSGDIDTTGVSADTGDQEGAAGDCYKTIIVTDCNGNNTLIYGLDSMGIGNGVGDAIYFGPDNALVRRKYHNSLALDYDTQTGKCVSARLELYTGSESSAQDIVMMLQSGGDIDAHLSNETWEMVAEDVYAVSADVDISTYFANIDQFVNTYLIEGRQNIDGFKAAVYYNQLSNFGEGSVLYAEDDASHFYGSIAGLALDFSN